MRKENKTKIRNQYHQVPHLTQDNIWESYRITRKHHNEESQEASPFPTGDHEAAMNRLDSMVKKNLNNKKDPQKKHRLGTVSNKITGGLKHV